MGLLGYSPDVPRPRYGERPHDIQEYLAVHLRPSPPAQRPGLSLKPEKCHFAFQQLKFLGHVVSPEGVSTDPAKTAAVSAFPKPADKRTVRRFLGHCAYYRRFEANFSKIAEPLTRLTNDDVPFVWGPEQTNAFDELKARLQKLSFYHFSDAALICVSPSYGRCSFLAEHLYLLHRTWVVT
ncbi:uncharacterized protein LOC144168039 [Haemaphysalis longicornis]